MKIHGRRPTADDLEWAVQYALMQGCFFPVPFPKPPYHVQDLLKWGALRHLHDVIAEYPFKRQFAAHASVQSDIGSMRLGPDKSPEAEAKRSQRILANLLKDDSMPEQVPTIGRIVHYRLDANDAAQINRRRTTGHSIASRLLWGTAGKHAEAIPAQSVDGDVRAWPAGAQAHIGNDAKEGDTFPMLITKVWGDTPTSAVNGQAFLDGNDVLWVTSASVGEGPRSWSWPARS